MDDNTDWFNSLPRGAIQLPLWFPCRYVLFKLGQSVADFLRVGGISKGELVLDYGCGHCPYLPHVEQRDAIYVGADMPGNKHADVILGANGEIPVTDGSYHAALSIQVLEHVPDPGSYLREVRRVLKPGGKLILSTHGIWVYHPGPLDLWRWTRPGLEKAIEDAGFRIITSRGLLGLLAAAAQLTQEYLESRLHQFFRKPFTAFMQKLVSLLDQMSSESSRQNDAMIFVVLAERI